MKLLLLQVTRVFKPLGFQQRSCEFMEDVFHKARYFEGMEDLVEVWEIQALLQGQVGDFPKVEDELLHMLTNIDLSRSLLDHVED